MAEKQSSTTTNNTTSATSSTATSSTTTTIDANSINITQDKPQKFESDLDLVKDLTGRLSRDGEFGFNNKNGNISLKRDGQITLSSKIDSQLKVSTNGTIESISLNNNIKTNFFRLDSDDIIVNNHKFNNKIIDLADYKQVLATGWSTDTCIAGGLTMLGTVLTKTWDTYLKRYVLIRRLANIPIFSPSLGAIDVHPGIQVTPSTERIKAMQEAFKMTGVDIDTYIKNTNSSSSTTTSTSSSSTTVTTNNSNSTDTANDTNKTTAESTTKAKDTTTTQNTFKTTSNDSTTTK